MIEIISKPEQYSSAYVPVVFRLKKTGVEADDVQIFCADELVGVKQYRSEGEILVNVADYCRGQFDVWPIWTDTLAPVGVNGRTASVAVLSPDQAVTLTAGLSTMTLDDKFSNAPHKIVAGEWDPDSYAVLSDGEFDEIACYGGCQTVIYAITSTGLIVLDEQVRATEAMVALIVDQQAIVRKAALKGIHADEFKILAVLQPTGRPTIGVVYQIVRRARCGARLAWWNRRGGIDYYTFKTDVSKSYAVKKTKVDTAEGWITTSSRVSESRDIVTESLPLRELEWLSEIISSPRVWMVMEREFRPVDVTSTEIRTYHNAELSQLAISIRPVKSRNIQRI